MFFLTAISPGCIMYILQMIELFYFALVGIVFLFAYGVAVQSLLYPNSQDSGSYILYKIFYHPYLSMFQEFESHIEELEGKHSYALRRFDMHLLSIYLYVT